MQSNRPARLAAPLGVVSVSWFGRKIFSFSRFLGFKKEHSNAQFVLEALKTENYYTS